MTADPFDLLGVAPRLDLDADDLEARYLALSRASHPDHHANADPLALAATLARSAAINDAYRTLRDPWNRARALCARLDPGALDATKQLAPAFLAEALELAEEVADASPATHEDLARRLRARIDEFYSAVGAALTVSDARRAATLIHQANYFKKALADLRGSATR